MSSGRIEGSEKWDNCVWNSTCALPLYADPLPDSHPVFCNAQIGNVYVKFREEEQASAALHSMSGRFYAGNVPGPRALSSCYPYTCVSLCSLSFAISVSGRRNTPTARITMHFCRQGSFLTSWAHPSFSGRPIMVEFCPVTDFREATCRQYEENTCNRGGYCNFMHLRKIGK